jgi:hypothetical protein
MPTITLVSNDYITVRCLPEEGIIHHTIHQPFTLENVQLFMDALEAGTAALQKYRLTKWLSDDRNNGPLPQETMDWSFQNWSPRTIAAGWKYWANVVPMEHHAAGTYVPVINHLYTLGLRMQVFTSVEDAFEWLAQF